MLIHKLAKFLSKRLVNQIGWQSKENLLTYGFELILGESIKFATLFIISAYFGVLQYTLLVLLAAVPFRLVMGGGHCKTYFRCFLMTILVYLFLSFLAQTVHLNHTDVRILFFFPILLLVCFTVIKIWVPGSNSSRNFTFTEILRFKSIAKRFVFLWSVSCAIIFRFWPDSFYLYFITTGIGIAWQSFFVTPAGYKILDKIEKVFDKIQIKGGEQHA